MKKTTEHRYRLVGALIFCIGLFPGPGFSDSQTPEAESSVDPDAESQADHSNETDTAQVNEPWSLTQLLEGLGAVEEAELDFTEVKNSPLLTIAFETQGDIVYRAPDYMKKTTREPHLESIAIDGDTLIIEKSTLGGKKESRLETQRFAISEDTLMSSAVGSIISVLSGDHDQLTNGYETIMSGPKSEWILILKPKLDVVREKVKHVELTGHGLEIGKIETTYPDDEKSSLKLTTRFMR